MLRNRPAAPEQRDSLSVADIDPLEIVDLINRERGTALRVVKRAKGGETEPWIVADDGGEYLLKWSIGSEFRADDAVTITQRLRARGYPLPAYRLIGSRGELRYSLRELIPGTPMGAIAAPYLPTLLKLNDLQEDAAVGIETDWPATIVESVMVGFRDWCVLDTMRAYSAETAAMLSRLQLIVQREAAGKYRTADAVHFDFHGSNILVDGGKIEGVIDWEGSRAGDRAFDLTTLLFYHYAEPEVRRSLIRRAIEISSEAALKLYLAHMIVRQVEWSLRLHSREVAENYLNVAREALRDLAA